MMDKDEVAQELRATAEAVERGEIEVDNDAIFSAAIIERHRQQGFERAMADKGMEMKARIYARAQREIANKLRYQAQEFLLDCAETIWERLPSFLLGASLAALATWAVLA